MACMNVHIKLKEKERKLFSRERKRLESFSSWTPGYINPEELAKAGFFYIQGHVMCIFCDKLVDDWEIGDQPMSKHDARCPFACGLPVGNIINEEETLEEEVLHSSDDNGMDEVTKNVSSLQSRDIIKHSTKEERLKSFIHWPKEKSMMIEHLADAGFYYTGQTDRVQCFQCNGGLQYWIDTDDPWILHSFYFSECAFVIKIKGQDFVQNVLATHKPDDVTQPSAAADERQLAETEKYFIISFRKPNKLRIINGNDEVVNTIREAIKCCNTQYVGRKRDSYNSFDFELGDGLLFDIGDCDAAVSFRKLACQILQDLYYMGWKITMSSNLYETSPVDCWFFIRTSVQKQTRKTTFCCLTPVREDSLQLIGFKDKYFPVIKKAFLESWIGSSFEKRPLKDEEGYEIKLNKKLWPNDKEMSEESQIFLQKVITGLAKLKYKFSVATKLHIRSGDSLFFRLDPAMPDGEQCLTSFILGLHGNDKIYLLNPPADLVRIFRKALTDFWPKGIQDEWEVPTGTKFKLSGNPWSSQGKDKIVARKLLCELFSVLNKTGWEICAEMNFSRKFNSKDTFLFSKTIQKTLQYMCISFHDTDKICVINSSDMFEFIKEKIGVQNLQKSDNTELKLKGHPWSVYMSEHSACSRCLMGCVLNMIIQKGWHFVSSADVSSIHDSDGPRSLDSWFFSH